MIMHAHTHTAEAKTRDASSGEPTTSISSYCIIVNGPRNMYTCCPATNVSLQNRPVRYSSLLAACFQRHGGCTISDSLPNARVLLRLMNHLLVMVQACSAADDFDG
jgi:hypothetical protein